MSAEVDSSAQPLQIFGSDNLSGLRDAAGPHVLVSAAPDDLARHAVDHSGLCGAGAALAVVYPRTTQDVSTVLRYCNLRKIPVVPQGGLTGMVGGALPVQGGIILSLQRMCAIEELDREAAAMVVQAGVPLQRIQQEAQRNDLSFPLDLGARGSCVIGGNIATNAGGNRVLRFGMARELVLGLEVVLADGTIISSLNKMLKNNAAYDLKHLFIGSEGTLGVITRAVLRLFPAPRSSAAAICAVRDYEGVLRFLALARSRLGGNLSAFEVMWKDFYAVALGNRSKPGPIPPGHELYILIEALGADGEPGADPFERLFEDAYGQGMVLDAAIAKSNAEIGELWAIRDSSGELDRLFGRSVSFDISIPVGAIAAFVADCLARLRAAIPQARMLVFGHIADSNIHLACRDAGDIPPKEAIQKVIYQCVGDWKGSVSAEHGIGVEKRQYLALSRSPEEIGLMRVLKGALDPNNILNPGKVIPDPG